MNTITRLGEEAGHPLADSQHVADEYYSIYTMGLLVDTDQASIQHEERVNDAYFGHITISAIGKRLANN